MTEMTFAELFYEEDSVFVFILISVLIGGGAAWLSGRAIASTWRPGWHVVIYMLILGLAVRFLHFALFEATLLSPHYYSVDAAVCLAFGFLGYRATRAAQMVTQYRWINTRTGVFSWRHRAAEAGPGRTDCG
jgi:NO-binding membrane sensor protein with MHYT domain